MALENRKKTVGIEDPDMASTMAYIAIVAIEDHDYSKANFFARQVRSSVGTILLVTGCALTFFQCDLWMKRQGAAHLG